MWFADRRYSIIAVVTALFCSLFYASALPAFADQTPAATTGTIAGVVTTQNGTIPLGAVLVSLTSDRGELNTATSDGDGKFRFEHVLPGKYSLVAVVEGFSSQTQPVMVAGGATTEAPLDLKLAPITERVDVVAPETIVPSSGTLASSENLDSRELDEIAPGGGLQSALRLLASVIQVPGGMSIKGGRPSQSTVQLGPGAFVDPATGLSQVSLPDDAIDSVTVLPNPYAVEFGRFSSGLVLIRTRRAADEWKTRINSLEPSFRTKRGEPLTIIGISGFSPRIESGGPLMKDKLFLQQAVQYRYSTSDVESRPQSELKTSQRLSSFTRIDANLSSKHSLLGAAGFFPTLSSQATLGTFTPPDATVDIDAGVTTMGLTLRSLWSDALFSELTGEVHSYDTNVTPQGPALMRLLPDTTLGNFYNRQRRMTSTYQVVDTLSGTKRNALGLHLFKFGFDLLHSRYDGSSLSRPVLIENSTGQLARRFDYGPLATFQSVNSTDVALFAQDRLQPSNRWYTELGARLDRDGVVGRVNVTPRVGAAVLLNQSGSAVLRSGYGLFYERTPSVAGVFNAFERPLDTRYAADGLTPISSLLFTRATDPNLRTSRSSTWDIAFDQRFNTHWSAKVSVIDRIGSHELLVQPRFTLAGPSLVLDSSGRSRYREAEFNVRYSGPRGLDLNLSYVRAQALADTNAFTTFFDAVLRPVVGENAYAPARYDVPNRFLARGRLMPTPRWLFVGLLDWRSGLPYSVVNESLDYVGPRNTRRFPAYVRVDLGVEHRFSIFNLKPWIGVRAENAFDSFLPVDVQNNLASPAFGNFYNTEYRQFRIQVRFER
jgi:hypothetical protein